MRAGELSVQWMLGVFLLYHNSDIPCTRGYIVPLYHTVHVREQTAPRHSGTSP